MIERMIKEGKMEEIKSMNNDDKRNFLVYFVDCILSDDGYYTKNQFNHFENIRDFILNNHANDLLNLDI